MLNPPSPSYPIPAESVTFSKMLQEQGYTTACIGKWGLGAPFTEGVPEKQGFDLFFGYNCQRQAHTYYPGHLWRNDEIVRLNNPFVVPRTTELDGDGDPNKSESYARYNLNDYAPALMLDETLGFLGSVKDKPFFLHFTTVIPHVPLQAPKEWVDKYREKTGEEEPYLGERGYFPCQYPMVIAYSWDEVKECYSYNPDIMMEIMLADTVQIRRFEDTGVPWRNIVAFVSHNLVEERDIFGEIHKKGAMCIVGSSRNHDIAYKRGEIGTFEELSEKYLKMISAGADIIEADLAIEAGLSLRKLFPYNKPGSKNRFLYFRKAHFQQYY